MKRLASFLAVLAFAVPCFAAAPAPPKAGDNETTVGGILLRDQELGKWSGSLNVGLCRFTGETTEACVVTSAFSFGPSSGLGAGGSVEQRFYRDPSGWYLFGSADLIANGGSAAQTADGQGSVFLGLGKDGTVRPRLAFFAQRPVGLKTSDTGTTPEALRQVGVTFSIGFGH